MNGAIAAQDLHKFSIEFPIVTTANYHSLDTFQQIMSGWNHIGLIATERASVFSDHQLYPNNLRMIASVGFGGKVIAQIIKYYQWEKIAILYNPDITSFHNYLSLVNELSGNVKVLYKRSVKNEDIENGSVLKSSKVSGAKIFILLLSVEQTAQILHLGRNTKVFTSDTLILSSEYAGTKSIVDYYRETLKLDSAAIAADLKGVFSIAYDPRFEYLIIISPFLFSLILA